MQIKMEQEFQTWLNVKERGVKPAWIFINWLLWTLVQDI